MKRAFTALVGLLALAISGQARADGPPPVKGKAPPAETPPAQAKTVQTKKPFDASELGARDAAADKDVARVDERCMSDPMSREGPSPEEVAKCNAAVARLMARGKKGAPSIFAALNSLNSESSYYGTNRLLFALGKIDDKKVRNVVLAGFQKIAADELDENFMMVHHIPETLEAMLGAAPEAIVPWEYESVTDHWEEQREVAARWKAFAGANADKSRLELAAERAKKARKEKADADPKKAYRAIKFLVSRSPSEALNAAKAYQKRKDLAEDVASEFESLQFEAEMVLEEQRARAARAKPKSKA